MDKSKQSQSELTLKISRLALPQAISKTKSPRKHESVQTSGRVKKGTTEGSFNTPRDVYLQPLSQKKKIWSQRKTNSGDKKNQLEESCTINYQMHYNGINLCQRIMHHSEKKIKPSKTMFLNFKSHPN
jgi:hypothetical protein